jgi:hypothetical protein
MKALLNEGTTIQEVIEKVKCSRQAVQYYKLNIYGMGKIKKEVYRKRDRPLLLIQEMRQVSVLFC